MAASLVAHVEAVSAKAAGATASPAPAGAKRVRVRLACGKAADKLRPQCLGLTQAEPKIVPFNGFFQYVWLPFVAGSGAITAASAKNGKNCGNGNNDNTGGGSGNQNNGNCPASP